MRVEVSSLSHTYPGKPPRPALAGLELSIPSGQFAALIGPSGCGKSTLLRLAANLLAPTEGAIRIEGRAPAEVNAARQIAWMAQSPALLPWLTVLENVALARRFLNGNHSGFSPEEALERVGLGGLDDVYPFTLSGGMQQRLALARLLIQPAGLWLMDEPFAALDEITRERLAHELLQLWQPLHPTVLWVTHHIHEALRLADRVLVLSASPGRLIADLPIDLPRPRSESDPVFQSALSRLRACLAQAQGEPSG
jgi:NitT/TauT family transport system ATP-binding protein